MTTRAFRAALTELSQLDKSDFDAALRKILSDDGKLLDVARVSYWELAPDHSSIRCKVLYHHATASFTEGGELRAEDFPRYFDALLETRVIVAHDAWTDPRTCEFTDAYFRPNNIGAMLDIPVWRRGKLAGVVCHEHVGGARVWTVEEEDFCAAIGNMVSVALESHDGKRAEESYGMLARSINDVLWDWDIRNDTIAWTGAMVTVFSWDVAQTSCGWWLDRLHPEDRPRVKARLAEYFASDRGQPWNEQYRWQRGDGSYATVIDRACVVRDAQGAPVRMAGALVDITERVRLQEHLARSDRMASIGTLAAGVAHEINNPLTYIRANLTSAIEDLRIACDPEAVVGLLQEALEGAERVRRVVRDLQMFSRPADDDTESLDVTSVIDSSIAMAWNEIRHRARLEKRYGTSPRVRINRSRLGQVVLNLLVNSAQAIREGNVETNTITVTTGTTPGGDVLIEIRDTGCGISPPVLGRIFEPFFTTKPVGVGTGLGLSICHGIVTAANGRIQVDSPPGGGCCVRVELPPCRDVIAVGEQPAAVVGRRRRVLLIDDEPAVGRVVRRMLRMHDVDVIEDGQRALDTLLGGASYDVIFCDLMMPKISGVALYEQLVAAAPAAAERVVFVTGGAFGGPSQAFLERCTRPVLEKPFDRAALLKHVHGTTATS